MFRKFVWLLLIFIAVTAYGQTGYIDSLKRNIAKANTPALQLKAIVALCEGWRSFSADTLLFYLHQAERISRKVNSPSLVQNQLRFYTACYFMKTGKTDSVISLVNSYAYKLGADSAEYMLQMRSFFLKGNALIRGGRYKESLDQFYMVLQMAISARDNFLEVMSRNSIGWAYMDMEQNATAVGWFRQAIAAAKDSLLQEYSFVYSNIASSYCALARYDSAEYFILKALQGARKNQDLTARANVLNILADVYINTKRKELAGESLEEALELRRQVGDTFYLVSDMEQLAVYYANNNQTSKGILTAKEGIETANRAGLKTKLLSLYEALAINYKNAGSFQLYSNTMEKIVAIKDSANKENTVDAMAQIKAQERS